MSIDTMDLELSFLLSDPVADPAQIPAAIAVVDEPKVYRLIPARGRGPCPWVGLLSTSVGQAAYDAGLDRPVVTVTAPTAHHARTGAREAVLAHAIDVVRDVIATRRTSRLRALLDLLQAVS